MPTRPRFLRGLVLLHLLSPAPVSAAVGGDAGVQELDAAVARLARRAPVAAALRTAEGDEARVLAWQEAVAAIPAPTGDEGARARWLQRQFEILGLEEVAIDGEGNVVGELPGGRPRPRALVTAHLDHIVPPGTDLTPRREGSRLVGPGIHDNARGVAVMLGAASVLSRIDPALRGPVAFAGTVGEEGLGDLRGMKALFAAGGPGGSSDYVVNVDGAGLDRVVTRGLGSRRYRVTYRGPGGHSWNDFGTPNPANALGRAVSKIAALPLPSEPRTSVTVGRLAGGTSVNAIPQEAWFEADLRSEDADALREIERAFTDAAVAALREERAVRGESRGRLEMDVQLVGDRPAGALRPNALLARAARAVTRRFGVEPVHAVSSTDANVPLSMDIEAVSLGGGGVGGRSHTADEWFDPAAGRNGVERLVLLLLLLAEVGAD
jgi:acetylornithine deacetylase/succinyl-diaminopimelate desuccinylase-like protein